MPVSLLGTAKRADSAITRQSYPKYYYPIKWRYYERTLETGRRMERG